MSNVVTGHGSTSTARLEAGHRPELQVAFARLEVALREYAACDGCHTEMIAAALWPLRGAFDRHLEVTEDAEGVFADVLRRAPALAAVVDRLRIEHVVLRARLERLLTPSGHPAGSASADSGAMAAIREHAPGLIQDFALHRRHEARLMFDAYLEGIGGD